MFCSIDARRRPNFNLKCDEFLTITLMDHHDDYPNFYIDGNVSKCEMQGKTNRPIIIENDCMTRVSNSTHFIKSFIQIEFFNIIQSGNGLFQFECTNGQGSVSEEVISNINDINYIAQSSNVQFDVLLDLSPNPMKVGHRTTLTLTIADTILNKTCEELNCEVLCKACLPGKLNCQDLNMFKQEILLHQFPFIDNEMKFEFYGFQFFDSATMEINCGVTNNLYDFDTGILGEKSKFVKLFTD
ncbi:hypothetical protein SNEBB_010383 [Seison nebaliae]|nr:hypothetical protein SNEBB_010383 [Seison nebaliae]